MIKFVALQTTGAQTFSPHFCLSSTQDGIQRGWMDDRVEARSALQKLSILQQLDGKLDRKTLPWGKALDQMDTIITV